MGTEPPIHLMASMQLSSPGDGDFVLSENFDPNARSSEGFSEEEFAALPSFRVDASNQGLVLNEAGTDPLVCVICQCTLNQNDRVKQLPCSHLFHESCLRRWLYQKANCPVCREMVRDSDRRAPATSLESLQQENVLAIRNETAENDSSSSRHVLGDRNRCDNS
ncbi:hypothetical protein BSKO_05954 [Bryopsis sp. KO-2023]|nr:hypothetical protein BSKO_05954 [Bryopsis sp. KO-2023]